MISKTGYHVYRIAFRGILFLFLFKFSFYSAAIGTAFPALMNGKLYIEPSVTLPVQGVVLDYSVRDTAILFVAKNEKEIVAGVYTIPDKNTIQFPIAAYSEGAQIKRIAFELDAVYICVHENDSILYRADMNTGLVKQVSEVSDFLLLQDGLVILKKDNTFISSDFVLPLYFSGKPSFKGYIDDRMVFVTDDIDTEVIDIKEKKAVYRYGNNVQLAVSSEYTVVLAINDIPTHEKASRVFYKIYCNGQDYGRTEPLLSINQSIIQLNLPSGQYHEIVIERWRLDENSEQYIRENNIRQPKPVILFIYPGRVIDVKLTYDGLEYRVVTGFKIIEK